MSSRSGFPEVAGYRLDERCDSDEVGAWYRGQATSGGGHPVWIRVVERCSPGARSGPRGGMAAGGPMRGSGPPADESLGRGILPVLELVPVSRSGTAAGGEISVALVYDDPGGVLLVDLLAEAGSLRPGQVAGLCGDIAAALRNGDGQVAAHGRLALSTVIIDRELRVWVSDAGVAEVIGVEASCRSDAVALARLGVLALTGGPPTADLADAAPAGPVAAGNREGMANPPDAGEPQAGTRENVGAKTGGPHSDPVVALGRDTIQDAPGAMAATLSRLALQPPEGLDVQAVADAATSSAAPEDLVVPPRLLLAVGNDLAGRLRALAGDRRDFDIDGPDHRWVGPKSAVTGTGRRLRGLLPGAGTAATDRLGTGRHATSRTKQRGAVDPRTPAARAARADGNGRGRSSSRAGVRSSSADVPRATRSSRSGARSRSTPAGPGRARLLPMGRWRKRAGEESSTRRDDTGGRTRVRTGRAGAAATAKARVRGVVSAPAGGAVLALVAALLLLVGVRAVTGGEGDAPVAAPTSPASQTSTPAPSMGVSERAATRGGESSAEARHTERRAPATAIEDPASPVTATRELAQALADLRRRAWSDLDLDAAALLNAPGSPAARADFSGIRQARADGVRYEGLAFVVRSARARDHDDDRVLLDLRMDVPAYSIETGAKPTRRPAAKGERVRLLVHWSGERWQVERVVSA